MRIVDTGTDILIKGLLRSITCDSIGSATVEIYENDIYLTETTTDSTGSFEVIIPSNHIVETRHFKVVYEGDNNYNPTESVEIIVEVREVSVLDSISLTSDTYNLQLGERFTLTAVCLSQYNEPLENVLLDFRSNGVSLGSKTTDNTGKCSLRITPDTDRTYTITAVSGAKTSNPVNIVVNSYNIYEILANLNDKIDNIGDIDLTGYVKKAEVDIELMTNGYFKLKLDLGDE